MHRSFRNALAAAAAGGLCLTCGAAGPAFSWGHPRFAPYPLDPATGEPAH